MTAEKRNHITSEAIRRNTKKNKKSTFTTIKYAINTYKQFIINLQFISDVKEEYCDCQNRDEMQFEPNNAQSCTCPIDGQKAVGNQVTEDGNKNDWKCKVV